MSMNGAGTPFARCAGPARLQQSQSGCRPHSRRRRAGADGAVRALASHDLFEPCFCRPGEGHYKGGVEARGNALRRQLFVLIPAAPTLDAINVALLAGSIPATG